jgi:hypothetical protein
VARIRRPSHATVVAYLALFVALGGTAMASVIVSKNSQVGRGTISGHHPSSGDHPNIIRGSVNGKDLASGFRASLRPRCPSGMRRAGGLCFEDSLRIDTFQDALRTCAAAGRWLPSAGELALAFEHLAADQPGQWVATPYTDNRGTSTEDAASYLYSNSSREVKFTTIAPSFPLHYRCVTSATN